MFFDCAGKLGELAVTTRKVIGAAIFDRPLVVEDVEVVGATQPAGIPDKTPPGLFRIGTYFN